MKFYQESDSKSSRKLFRFSLLHLPLLMGLLLLTKKHWDYTSTGMENTEKIENKEKSIKDDLLFAKDLVLRIRHDENISNSSLNSLGLSVPVSTVPLEVSIGS